MIVVSSVVKACTKDSSASIAARTSVCYVARTTGKGEPVW